MISISVVCPVFNSSKFIEETLRTVLLQSRKPDQLIIIDDGSEDDTVKVVTRFLKQNAFDIDWDIVNSSHRGPGAARNIGINLASSDWVAFLDSDDLWSKEKLDRVEKVISTNTNTNFICHNELYIRQNKAPKTLSYSDLYKPNKSLTTQLYLANIFSTSAVICKKTLLLKYSGFSETLMSAQDYELWIKMSKSIRPILMRDVLGTYVERNGNITSCNMTKRMKNELIIAINYRKDVHYVWFLIRMLRISLSFLRQYVNSLKKL